MHNETNNIHMEIAILITTRLQQALAAYGGVSAALLAAACADPAPAIAHAACEALARWAASAGARLRPVIEGLVAAVLPLVTHPHSQVRQMGFLRRP